MGFVIESGALAQKVDTEFAVRIPTNAYEVRLAEGGKLHWLERRGGELLRHDVEPGTGFWERTGVAFISFLPVDWLL
jgi:putative cardiolipin synthase